MGTLSLVAPLVHCEKSRLWASTGFHLIPSFHHHPTQHNYTTQKQLHIQSPLPQLPTVHYTDTHTTRNVVCPSGAWLKNRPHSTLSICLVQNPKHVIVQWVCIGTHTHTFQSYNFMLNNWDPYYAYLYCLLTEVESEVLWKEVHCTGEQMSSGSQLPHAAAHVHTISGKYNLSLAHWYLRYIPCSLLAPQQVLDRRYGLQIFIYLFHPWIMYSEFTVWPGRQ